ncbi:MAG: histidine kinase, partial [Lewinella sp.]|nr:histidine kinase [Lewinella sp.]
RGSNGSSVKYLTESKDSAVWVMLPKRVARLTSRDTLYYSLPVTGTGVEQTTFLHEDQQGRVWAGTLSKLFVLFPGTSTFRPVDLLPPGATDKAPGYNALTEFPNGDLLIATNILFPLIIKADLTESRWLDMSIARPRYLYKGVGQEFFIHTFLGVFYIGELDQSDSYKIDTTFRQLSFLTAIQWDADRQLYWVGTSNGLFRLRHTDTGWSFQKEDHFDFNLLVSGLLLDNAGKLWMSIPGNLMAYDPDSLRYDLYHKADGLQGPDYNDMAVLQHSDGRFFFGGTNGITVFRPQNIDSEIPLARPAIVNIKINQEEDLAYQFSHNRVGNIMEIRQLKLPYTLNNLTFTAAPMEYSDPQNCRFSYQLKGSTTDAFIENGNNPQIAFSRLSPGKYELNIRSTNSDGVVSESTDPIHIEILPPWYQTSWFYLLAILAIIGIVFLIIRNRFREAMRRQTLAQEVSEARRKAAEAQRNEAEAKRLAAETETAVLRLQMDPHFIFNSMNAIDAFILQGEKLRAHDYLVYFSELMRGILNNSEKTYTNLEDEIDLLKKYLQVEQMRIGPRLTYTVLPAPEVDTYETEIPTMILQPFVENAIWHGISPKSGPGHIRINFFQKEDLLICEVLDDGVGRGYTSRAKPHKSKATKITERRLALLPANKDGRSAQFEIIDEQDQSGQPCGTSVRFFFPLTQPANTP